MPVDPYLVLEVSPDATGVEIKAAYRRLAATYHPDRNPGFQDAATEKLKELNAAYEIVMAGGPRAENPDEAPGAPPDHRSTIAAELALIGLLADAEQEDDLTVDVLASLIPSDAGIALCVGFGSFGSSGDYDLREVRRSVSRIADLPEMSSMPSLAAGARPAIEGGGAILCAGDLLIWTTRRVAPVDSIWEEVSVTAYALSFPDILGARTVGRRQDEVQVWIDEGPTLTFSTARLAAEKLSGFVDAAAVSY